MIASPVLRSMLFTLAMGLFLGGPAKTYAQDADGIIGGEVTDLHSKIGRATVMIKAKSQLGVQTCSGVLIDRDIVLTAAHCVDYSPSHIKVLTAEGEAPVLFYKDHIEYRFLEFKQDGKKMAESRNDIAVLRLAGKVKRDMVAKLPKRALKPGASLPVIAAGYGVTDQEDHDSIGVLNHARFTATMIEVTHEIREPQLELAGDEARLCHADSGGPVFEVQGDTLTVIGIESYGLLGCEDNDRAVSVAHYLRWIREAIVELRGI